MAKFVNMIFEPNGMTDDKDVRIAQSLVDYLARRLAIDYLDVETRQALGIKTTAERTAEVNGTAEPAVAEPVADVAPAPAPVEPRSRRLGRPGPGGPGRRASAPVPAPLAPAFTPGMAAVDALYCSTCGVHAAGRFLLRLRVLRHHERVQLSTGSIGRSAQSSGERVPAAVGTPLGAFAVPVATGWARRLPVRVRTSGLGAST